MTSSQRRAAPSSDSPARDRLLTAAAELISSGGPQAATSRAITDAAGENLGAITYYFGSKDKLVSETLTAAARRLIEPVVAQLTDQGMDPVSKLLAAVQTLQQILVHSRDQLPAYIQSLAAATTDDTLRNEVQRLHRELVTMLATELTAQREAGSLPSWVTPDSMAQLIVALVDGVALAATIDPDETDAPAIAAQFVQLLLAARIKPI